MVGRKKGNLEADIGCRFGGGQLKSIPADGFHFLSKVPVEQEVKWRD